MTAPELTSQYLAMVLQRGWELTATRIEARNRWFTGKSIARCDIAGKSWGLIGAPGWAALRTGIGATFQEQLDRAGCSGIPSIRRTLSGDLLHRADDRVWSLTEWMDGAPEYEQGNWTDGMLQQLGRAIGELHRRGEALVASGARPPAVPARFWAGDWLPFGDWAAERWRTLNADPEVRGAPELEPLRESIALGFDALPRLPRPSVRRLTLTHDDLWTEHVLFSPPGRLTGIIDLEGLDVGDAVGDLAALLSDFAILDPERCAAVVRGYGAEVGVSKEDLAAALAVVIRHHLLTLITRIQLWCEKPDRRHDLINPVGYWLDSLRHAVGLNSEVWASDVLQRARDSR